MFPVVKHLNPKASDGVAIFQKGQQYVSQGYLKDGQTLIQEALQLFTSVYGNIHTDVINSYRMLARLDYIQGNHTEAIEKQHKVKIFLYFENYSYAIFCKDKHPKIL